MTFEYLRNAKIWNMFCATYEGIYNKMGEFDEWYTDPSVSSILLQIWADPLKIFANDGL